MSTYLYEVSLQGKNLPCDNRQTYFKSGVLVRIFVKESMKNPLVDELKVTRIVTVPRVNRLDLLNRSNFVSSEVLYTVTREQWEVGTNGLQEVVWRPKFGIHLKMKGEKENE